MWLIGKMLNWANWNQPAAQPDGRSAANNHRVSQSLPSRISPALRWTLPIVFADPKANPVFPKPVPGNLAPGSVRPLSPAALFGRSTPGHQASKRHSDELMPSRRAGFVASTPSSHGFASAESVGRRSAHRAPPPPPGRVCGPCEQPPPGLPPDPGSSGWH